MSSKGQTTGKDPKLPKKEVMVTRHKSAQMKRQLRTKDRSMKHITDLLKSPTKETPTKTAPVKKKPSPKAKQSLLQSVQKIQNLPRKTFKLSKVLRKEIHLVQDEEYHPNKRKRKRKVNKVVLKPKPNMKVVGEIAGSVKRKYAVPLKAYNKPVQTHPARTDSAKLSAQCVKLSMAEAIQIMDEQLTDEDLMEILTCPSPVWWEDPPDEDHIEDAIFTRSPSVTEKKEDRRETPVPMEVDADVAETETGKIIPISNLSAKSDKFLKKRSKLEDLLGNIKDINNKKKAKASNEDVIVISSNYSTNEIKKDKASDESEDVANNDIEEDVANNEIEQDVANNEIEKDVANNEIEHVASNEFENDVANNQIEHVANNEIEEDVANNKIKDVANNEIEEDVANDEIEEDVAINDIEEDVVSNKIQDDVAINYVEEDVANNKIKKDVAINREKTETKLSESDDEIILHNSSMNEDELLKDLENMDIPIADEVIVIDDDDDFLEKPSENTVQESKKEDSELIVTSTANKGSIKDTDNSKEVPKNLSALQKCVSEDIASPKSLGSLSSKSSVGSSTKDIDSLSDTNVRFLIEEEDKYKMVTQDNERNKCTYNESTESDKVINDSVTVYKIADEIRDTTYNNNNDNEKATPNENILNIVDAKLNDYFKKCKKVNQKKIKKETDINKNEMAQNGDADFSTVSCDKCKPTFKKVSEYENVKYCLKCSAIFDSKDCTYCIKKLNKACVPCKIKFCCASYFKSHIESCTKLRSILCKDNVSGVFEKIDNVDTKVFGLQLFFSS